MTARNVLPVVCPVFASGAIYRSPHFLQRLKEILIVMFGSLEHHVFKKVSKTGPAWFFIFRADVIPDIHRDHWDRMIFMQDDIEAIWKSVFFKLQVRQGSRLQKGHKEKKEENS